MYPFEGCIAIYSITMYCFINCTKYFVNQVLIHFLIILLASRKTDSLLPESLSWSSLLICIVFATLALFSKEQGITVLVCNFAIKSEKDALFPEMKIKLTFHVDIHYFNSRQWPKGAVISYGWGGD